MATLKEIESLRAFFQKVDRIISGRNGLKVEVVNLNIPASTSGVTIYLNKSLVSSILTFRDIKKFAVLKGLNYHELAHCLFSGKTQLLPYESGAIYNVLEDARIESLFSILYPKARNYFKCSFYDQIWDEWRQSRRVTPVDKFLFLYSRRFVLRDEPMLIAYMRKVEFDLKKKYGFTDSMVSKLKALIDEFLTSWDIRRREKIAKEIYTILHMKSTKPKPFPDTSHASAPNNSLSKKLSKELKNKLDEVDKEIESSESIPNPISGKADSNEEKVNSNEEKATLNEIEEKIEEEIEKVFEEVEEESIKDMSTIYRGVGSGKSEELKLTGSEYLSEEAKVMRRIFYNEFRRIKKEADYGWIENMRSGRLNLKNLVKFETTKKAKLFRKWKTGNLDKFSLDVLCLVDVSGSMYKYEKDLRNLLLAFGDALEKVNLGKIALGLFSDYYGVVKRFESKKKNIKVAYRLSSGGTVLYNCLENWAIKEFVRYSNSRRKVLIIFTDGELYNMEDSIRLLKKLKVNGVEVYIVFPFDEEALKLRKKLLEHYKDFHRLIIPNYEINKVAKCLRKIFEGGEKYEV